MKPKVLIFFVAVLLAGNVDAQILKGILKEGKKKAKREVENMIVRKASDMIAAEITKSLEGAIDNMFKQWQDSIRLNSEDTLDYEGARNAYFAFLTNMNESVDLPKSYAFDLTLVTETSEDNREALMHFSEEQAVFGIGQEENGDKMLIVLDLERDATILYQENRKGEKTAQVLPSLRAFAAMGTSNTEFKQVTIEKTGGSKTVAGYSCEEFQGESEDIRFTYYVAQDLDIEWNNSYGALIEQVAPSVYEEQIEKVNGMILESITTEKMKNKKKEKPVVWTTVEVIKELTQISQADYTFSGLGQ
jgi:hypothetical protein